MVLAGHQVVEQPVLMAVLAVVDKATMLVHTQVELEYQGKDMLVVLVLTLLLLLLLTALLEAVALVQ